MSDSNGAASSQSRPGNVSALRHGAFSERQIRPVAARHRRNVLRQLQLHVRDLDPIGKGYLDSYIRLRAKLEAIDLYVDEHGLIREDGEPQPVLRLYVSLQNSARLALQRLEQHLGSRVELDGPLAIIESEGRRLRLAAEETPS